VLKYVGTSGDDNITVSRVTNAPIPRTTRYIVVINSDGSIRTIDGAPDGPLLNPPGKSKAGEAFLGSYIRIQRGATDYFVDASAITGVEVFGGDGDDKITAANNLKLSTTLHGGIGDDTLVGSRRADHLLGDDGSDYLFGGRGLSTENVLDGGDGADTVVASSKMDEIIGPPDTTDDRVIVLLRRVNSVPPQAKSIFAGNYVQDKPRVVGIGNPTISHSNVHRS
jgi:Ca2+-binding RTX toxin-like protein